MVYSCDLCEYRTSSRKSIRKHAKTVHKLKGTRKGSSGVNKTPSDISPSYENINSEEENGN